MSKNLIVLLAILTNIIFINAQVDNKLHTNPKKEITTQRISNTMTIDGQLNESEWLSVQPATDFVMFEPDNGRPIAFEKRTEVKILYDNDAIYVGAILYDNDQNKILKELAERDNFGISDVFGIFINGYNDGQQDFRFFVTAAGGQLDCVATEQTGEDFSWNAIWESKAKITDFGWVVEMKIPYAALRFSEEKNQTWGLNFVRELRRDRQVYTWNPVNANIGAIIQQAGILKGINEIKTPTRLFLIPYASSYVNHNNNETTKEFKGGLDIKYGINDAYTLDAILIPDFGQTRFDDVILNLGPFEQQFNENRPFFTEGTDLFNKGNLLYSRRIGETPRLNPKLNENESFSNYPSSINLLNALKVSGRDKDGLGIGILNAVSESTSATAVNEITGESREVVVSPLTNYNVTVFDQRFNQNSSVTLINTNVTRDGSFRDANVTGLLFDLNTKKNTYNLSGDMKMSSIYGETVKSGINTSLYFAETSGKFRFGIGGNYVSKDFDNNDLGINFLTNFSSVYTNASYRILNPTKIFNTFRLNFNSYSEFNNETGRIQSNNFNLNLNSTDKKNHYYGAGLNFNPFDTYDYYEPRSIGRYAIYPQTYGSFVYFSSNYNNKFALDLNPSLTNTYEKDRYNYALSVSPRYRFSDKFSMIYRFNYSKQNNEVGYIDSDVSSIYFAQRDRDTYTNSITSKFSINSDMNFNLLVRHYWSYAENNTILTLNEDGTFNETSTYTNNRNSNFSTWNMDLTYSWWFAPGSQLSVLYRNNAGTFTREINRDFGNNFNTLISDNLNHIFSVSIRYFIDYNQAKNWIKKV
jgi:hypothetical protein